MVKIKRIALIPTYEPTEKLLLLLKELYENNFEIVVVNDGSGEKYEAILSAAMQYAKVISYAENKGKGEAIKNGLIYIKQNNLSSCIIVTMDDDGQHTVQDAIKLYRVALQNQMALIIGKRIRNEKTPLKSKLGNSITRFIYRISTGVDVYDTQTGLRAFHSNLIDFLLDVHGARYEYEMNVLLECSARDIEIKEVEVETIYFDNNSNSHFNTLKDSLRIYKEIIKFSISSIISFLIDYLCYTVIFYFSKHLILSNMLARIISATVNYNINRKIVFARNNKISKTVTGYFILAVVILLINTILLNAFVEILHINALIAKILTEVILFLLSYIVQNKLIFKKGKTE